MKRSFQRLIRNSALATFLILMVSMAYSQNVSGVITDAQNGEPLIGASITVKGTVNGTITDIDGSYSIPASGDDVLVISYVGYDDLEEAVAGRSVVNIGVQQGVLIDEVVVTGYQSQRERDITGAVAVLKSDELNEVTAASFSQKLEGRVSGLNISTSGAPGDGTSIRIRGISSFQNNDPLIIIDGVPTTDSYNNSLNPNDIESIQVLKDASSASIYGARANNGVVIITTKKGQKGSTKVTYNATVGSQTPVGKYDLIVDPSEYSEVVWRSFDNAGVDIPAEVPYSAGRGVIPDYIYAGDFSGYPGTNAVNEDNYSFPNNLIMRSNPQGTDWWDEVFNPALIMEHTLGVSGGGENSTFALSFGYLDQDGTMIHTDFDRFSLRANSSFTKGRFSAGENFAFSRATGLGQQGGNQSEGNIMTQILKAQSIVPVYDITGVNFAGGKANGLSNGSNPVAQQVRSKDNRGTFYKALGNVYGQVELIDGLKVRTSLGMEYFNNFTQGFSFPTWEESEPNVTNSFREENQGGFNYTWTNTATYNTVLDGVHDIGILVGYEAIKGSSRTINGSLSNYFTTDINAWYLNTGLGAPDSRNVNSFGGFSTLASAFAKVDYSYNDTYLLSATIRRDGSSNFGPNFRYGVFPAVSFGWRLSNESFLAGNDFIDDLKLRVGWGITGNQTIPGGNTVNRFGGGPGNSFYDISGTNSLATGYALTNRGNADSKWEENVSLNFGIDGAFMNGKFDFVLDLYQRTTDGLLFNPVLPATAGSANPPFVNIAKMENRGIDFAINYRDKSSSSFGYNIGLNLSAYQNEILEIDGSRTSFFSPGGGRIGNTGYNAIGGSIGAFYGWQTDGIFKSQAEVDAHANQTGKAVGQFRLKDLDGDGEINDNDLGTIGSPHPDFTLGINLGVNFGNVDISTFWTASVGNEIYNYNKLFEVFRFFNTNVRKDVLDRAFDPVTNPDGDFPMINENDIFSENSTDFYVEDGTYLRAKTIQIGYTLSNDALSGIGLGSARIYVQGQNLLTLTGYEGIDPALSSFGLNGNRSDQRMGFDFGNYPQSKIIQFGVSASF